MIDQVLLFVAAAVVFIVGMAHSIMGERGLVTPLLNSGRQPQSKHGQAYMRAVVRGAWHLTTVLCWALAGVLVLAARQKLQSEHVALMFGWLFMVLSVASLILARGRHPSWIMFLVIGILCLLVAFT